MHICGQNPYDVGAEMYLEMLVEARDWLGETLYAGSCEGGNSCVLSRTVSGKAYAGAWYWVDGEYIDGISALG